MSKLGRVLVAMSGGIDSTVTAMMMHEQGYEVIGITMKTWDYANSGGNKKETGCCSLDSINDARQVAVNMGFHHFIVDIREDFGDYVIDNFVDEYMAGRTPNPCVLCNTHIKWNSLLKRADALDCEFIATGHYAIINEKAGRKFVTKAVDDKKIIDMDASIPNIKKYVKTLKSSDMDSKKLNAVEESRQKYETISPKEKKYYHTTGDYINAFATDVLMVDTQLGDNKAYETDQGMLVYHVFDTHKHVGALLSNGTYETIYEATQEDFWDYAIAQLPSDIVDGLKKAA